jgi:ABC-type lipoprotein export system ATPase subunit
MTGVARLRRRWRRARTAAAIARLFGEITHERGCPAVIATHDPALLEEADRYP